MVVRRLNLLTLSSILAAAAAFGSEPALSPEKAFQEARAALEREDPAAALKLYGKIPLKHPLWKEKIEDLIRYELLHRNPEEAWRIVQVEKRVSGREAPELADYERLAIFRARACPLALEGNDQFQAELVNAATYRFFTTNFGVRDRAEVKPIEGASLASGLTHYLAEIPTSRLQTGRGCRAEKMQTRSPQAAARREMESLLAASAKLASVDLPSLLFRARMLELAGELRDSELSKALEDRLPPETMIPWLKLPDAERRRLFAHYFRANRVAELKGAPSQKRASEIAAQVLRGDPEAHVTSWLAMMDFGGLAAKERAELLAHIEKTWRFNGRGWILFQLAESRYELGEAAETLTVLRRLLLEREEEAGGEIEAAAVELAARIFAEYRFEDQLVGAMRAAMPSRLWMEMLDRALIVAAVEGRGREFAKLMKLESHRLDSFRARELELWRALAERGHARFLSQIKKLGRGPGADRALIELGGRFASELIGNPEHKSLQAFARSLALELRDRLRPGDTRIDEINNLAQILEDESQWAQGARAVRQGILNVGVARWGKSGAQPPAFKFEVPNHLPERELVMVPERATNRAWVLSIEKR